VNIVLLIFLIIVIALNLFLAYTLYKAWDWRKRINENSILLPDQFYKDLEAFNNTMKKNHEELVSLNSTISEKFDGFNTVLTSTINKNAEYFHNIYDALIPLKKMIEKQDKEIDRFKEGYDSAVKQKIIVKLFDLKERIEFYSNPSNNNDSSVNITEEVVASSKNILKVLEYLFKTEGVKNINISPGSSIESIDSNEIELLPQNSVKTKDTNLIGNIVAVVDQGYYLEGLEGNKYILKKATVKYYIEEKENG